MSKPHPTSPKRKYSDAKSFTMTTDASETTQTNLNPPSDTDEHYHKNGSYYHDKHYTINEEEESHKHSKDHKHKKQTNIINHIMIIIMNIMIDWGNLRNIKTIEKENT
eukprot:UN27172